MYPSDRKSFFMIEKMTKTQVYDNKLFNLMTSAYKLSHGHHNLQKNQKDQEEWSEVEPEQEIQIRVTPVIPYLIRSGKKNEIQFNTIENTRKSSFSHKKFIAIEKMIFGITILGFFLSFIKTQADLASIGPQVQITLLAVISANTIVLAILLLFRYVALFSLQVDQKKLYIPEVVIRDNKQVSFRPTIMQFFKRSESLQYLAIEVVLIALHPMPFFKGLDIYIFQSFSETYKPHAVNNLLGTLMLIRVYLLIRCLINFTMYATPRCERLCLQTGHPYTTTYSVKCILYDKPLIAIFIVFSVSLFILGFGMRLSQGLINQYSQDFINGTLRYDLSNYINCLWCIFITMSTVGYGDQTPKTKPGMLMSFFAAGIGVTLTSLLIVGLTSHLNMRTSQYKAHVTLKRLREQEIVQEKAKLALNQVTKLNKFNSNQGEGSRKSKNVKLKAYLSRLKTMIEQAKESKKRLKSLVDDYSILQEMNRLFAIVRDNFRDLQKNQQIIHKQLGKVISKETSKNPTIQKSSLRISQAYFESFLIMHLIQSESTGKKTVDNRTSIQFAGVLADRPRQKYD